MTAAVRIDRDAIYDDEAVRLALGVAPAVLLQARRSGALRHARQGQRTLYRGAWLLDWLDETATPAAARPGVAAC